METKNTSRSVRKIINQYGFVDMVLVDPVHVMIDDPKFQYNWHLFFVYIAPVLSVMKSQFNFLMNYCNSFKDILIVGDFNAILRSNGKRDRQRNLCPKSFLFHNVVNSICLRDLSFKGPITTWNNRWTGDANEERLDRGLAFINWFFQYPYIIAHHLEDVGSDHRPILFNLNSNCAKVKNTFV